MQKETGQRNGFGTAQRPVRSLNPELVHRSNAPDLSAEDEFADRSQKGTVTGFLLRESGNCDASAGCKSIVRVQRYL